MDTSPTAQPGPTSKTEDAPRHQGRNRRWRTKEAQILAAAERVFMARGYAGASMDAIAAEAGVSKQTLYHHHGGKESLFAAIVDARVDQLLLPLATDELSERSPRAALRALGLAFLDVAVSPSSIALHRAVVTEAERQPELGRAVFEHGPERAVRVLAGYLREMTDAGRLAVAQPDLAAEQFYGMILGHNQLRGLLAAETSHPPDWDHKTAVDTAVSVFLTAYSHTHR